jgi:uncharacterized protein YbaR (Trm112 family)
MISKELLDLLVCPENRTPLTLADDELLAKVNRAITAGSVKNRSGQQVSESLSGALVRQDGRMLYPIVDDIPIMLVEEAIPLEGLEAS